MGGWVFSRSGPLVPRARAAMPLKSALAGLAVLCVIAGCPPPASAANWYQMPGTTSADLAGSGWLLLSSSGLSWPDGRQAIVTFWKNPDTAEVIRCIGYFEADMSGDGEACEEVL